MSNQEPPATPVDDIWVWGTRAVVGGTIPGGAGPDEDPGPIPIEVEEGSGTSPLTYTQETAEEENERQKVCAAAKFLNELNTKSDKNSREYFAYIFERSAETISHPARAGSDDRITAADRNSAREDYQITWGSIRGLSHNHPAQEYCPDSGFFGQEQRYENQFPSVNDWAWADAAVDNGTPAQELVLFVTDCEGATRAFPYSQKTEFQQAVSRRDPAPGVIQPEGCPE